MAEKGKSEKKLEKTGKPKLNALQKAAALFVKTGKKLKSFFLNLKAELKRVVWPDRKRLIQNTATVLAICVIVGLLLFLIDSFLAGSLNALGFYAPNTTAATTTVSTTTAGSGETTAAGTTAGTTETGATTAAGTTAD